MTSPCETSLFKSKSFGFIAVLLATLFATFAYSSARAAEVMPGFKQGFCIVFQGDSITDGGRARSGNDYNHTMGQSYAFLIAARLSAILPERQLTFYNRGNSGNTIKDLSGRWQKDTLDLKPDILSIHVGINDSNAKCPWMFSSRLTTGFLRIPSPPYPKSGSFCAPHLLYLSIRVGTKTSSPLGMLT